MNYSEALEQQVRLLAWARSDRMPSLENGRHIQQALEYGDTFYISPEIGDLLVAAARSYPKVPLTARDLPVTHGFAWFAKPLPLPPDPYVMGDIPAFLDAIAWMPATFTDKDKKDGIIAGFWVDTEQSSWGFGIALWNYGDGWHDFTPVFDAIREPAGATAEGHAKGVTHIKTQRRYLATLFNLVSQRILVTRSTLAERHVRKRAVREGWQHQPLVRVVELRRKERIGEKHPVEVVEREWACQWVVRGHWRQQFYPSKHQNQPIWITPYVKGPEDKPLKPPRATVFAVVR